MKHLLLGKENFLKQEFLRSLKAELFPKGDSGLNCQEFNAPKDGFGGFLDFCQTAPFLAEKRMAVLWEASALSTADKALFLPLAQRLPATAEAVFVSDESNPGKDAFLKALSEACKTQTFYAPFERDLPAWIEGQARKKGKALERDAVPLLMERAGKEPAALVSALEQLAVYAGDRRSIAASDVAALLGKSAEEDVFRLSDCLVQKDAPAALRLLAGLFRGGARGPEVLAVLSGQMERLKRARFYLESGRSPAEIGTELRVHGFFLDKFIRQVRALDTARASAALERLLACEESIKTGCAADDRLEVERAVIELTI